MPCRVKKNIDAMKDFGQTITYSHLYYRTTPTFTVKFLDKILIFQQKKFGRKPDKNRFLNYRGHVQYCVVFLKKISAGSGSNFKWSHLTIFPTVDV